MAIRIPLDAEIEGMDVSEHGEDVYFGGELASLTGAGIGSSVMRLAGDPPPTAPGWTARRPSPHGIRRDTRAIISPNRRGAISAPGAILLHLEA